MSVYERVHAVLSELPAIGKSQRAPGNMGGYAFRGIEDITAALKPLLAKHGVFMVPTVVERRDSERKIVARREGEPDKTMFVVDLLIRFTFYSAQDAGIDMGSGTEVPKLIPPSSFAAEVWGEGTDMGDKATQKAVTSAFKSMLSVTFCIADAETDAERHDVPDTARPMAATPERVAEVRALVDAAGIAEWVKDQGFAWPWTPEACDAIEREAHKVAPPVQEEREPAGGVQQPEEEAASPPAAPSQLKVGAATLGKLQSRLGALVAAKVPVADARMARGLPKLDEDCTTDDAHGWAELLTEFETELAESQAPFEQPELKT